MANRRIDQWVHTLSYGDAISGAVLALQRALRARGFESEVYSINTHPKLAGMARDYRDFEVLTGQGVVLHYSLGSVLNARYRELQDVERTLVYHNITPPHWFSGVNPRVVRDISSGLAELPELCRLSDRLLADSPFNQRELKELGFDSEVLELPLDTSRWSVESNAGIAKILMRNNALNFLHVGRLAPNKRIEDIIKIFYLIHQKIEPNSRLWLVGIDIDTELYSFTLKRMVRHLGIEKAVQFVGCFADSELRALYEGADCYLCMSEHEGFCLPVVEAMHFGVPVIAYASTALPETVQDGGILVTEKRYPEIAELAVEVCRNQELRDKLISRGRERVRKLGLDTFSNRVAEIFTASLRQAVVGE